MICPPTYHNRAKCFFFFMFHEYGVSVFKKTLFSVIKRCFHGLQNVAIHNFRYTALGKLWQNLHSKGKLGFSMIDPGNNLRDIEAEKRPFHLFLVND